MKNMKKRQGILAGITALLVGGDLPISLPGEYYLELVGGEGSSRALISGIDRLLACGREEVAVLKKGKRLRLIGRELSCLTYMGGVLEIKGDIDTLLIESVERT